MRRRKANISGILIKLVGFNWKTTLLGLAAISSVVGKILLAWRTKDIVAVFSNGQDLMLDVGIVLGGIGLIKAKDANTVGAGVSAAKVHDDGSISSATTK
jgi:hypothetical protein